MESKTNPTEALSEVLQWTCSPRGGNNFYGRVLNGCGRNAKEGVKTACVTLTKEGKYLFLWDPDWFSSQSMALRVLVAIHEASHIVLQHLERMLRFHTLVRDPEIYRRLQPFFQIAADMAANDVAIRPFIEMAAFRDYKHPLLFPEHPPFNFPQGESFEQYFARLLDKAKQEGYDPVENGDGNGESKAPKWLQDIIDALCPRHVPWWEMASEMTDAEIERIAQRARRESKGIVKKALEQTIKSRGTLPGNLQSLIDELLKEPTVPWELILKGMLKSAISSKLQESVVWPNASLMTPEAVLEGLEPYPGFQKDFEFHIAVAVDTSGSVSNEEFVKFLSEIQGIQKTNKAVTVQMLMFDAAIQHEFLLSENDKIEHKTTRYGYGGTDFTPPLKRIIGVDEEEDWEKDAERISQHIPNADLVVMFTDGWAPVGEDQGGPIPAYTPPCPLLWVLTPEGKVDDAMGDRVVKIVESY